MRLAAGLAHGADLVVERLPVLLEHMRAGDDDVDLARALADRIADFLQPQRQRRQPGGKAGRDRGDRNAGALERLHRGRHHRRIDADRADRRHVIEAERLDEIAAERIPRLGAEPLDARRRVVAGKRGQVDAGDRLDEPGRLPLLLHRAARRQRRRAPLDGGKIHARALDPIGVKRRAFVPRPVRVGMRPLEFHAVLRTQPTTGSGIGLSKTWRAIRFARMSDAPLRKPYYVHDRCGFPAKSAKRSRKAIAGLRQIIGIRSVSAGKTYSNQAATEDIVALRPAAILTKYCCGWPSIVGS